MARRPLFGKLSASDERSVADVFRTERAGGIMLLLGTVAALIWANSRWSDSYESVLAFEFGPESLHLHLSVETWAADGLLAIFFFVIGLELKRELTVGELSKPATAIVPAIAGLLLFARFGWVLVTAAAIGALAGAGGYVAAFFLDLPVGACQAAVASAILAIVWLGRVALGRT